MARTTPRPARPTSKPLDRFRKLVAQDDKKGTDDYLVSALINQYRAHLKTTRKSGVPGVFEIMARGFTAKHGKLKVGELKPHHVEDWLGKQDKWNNTTKAHAGKLILAAVSWARKKGIHRHGPHRRAGRPAPADSAGPRSPHERGVDGPADRRGPHEQDAIAGVRRLPLGAAGDGGKAGRVAVGRGVQLRERQARLPVERDARVRVEERQEDPTGPDHLPDARGQAYVEKLVAKQPKGLIFRTPRDAGWLTTSIGNKWRWLVHRPRVVAYCEKHDIDPDSLKPYNFRHSAISAWVDRAGDIYVGAQVFGTSVKMIETRYGHPNVDLIHEKVLAFHRMGEVGATLS